MEWGSLSNHSLFPMVFFFLLFVCVLFWFALFVLCFVCVLFCLVLTCFSVLAFHSESWELCSARPSLVNGFSFKKLPFCDTPPNKYLGKFPTTPSLYAGAHFISKSWTKPSMGVDPLTPGHPLCEGAWPHVTGRQFVSEEWNHFGGETQAQFKAGQGVVQQFHQEQGNDNCVWF